VTATPMRRREFVTLLGTSAAAWPLAAGAQQPAMPVVGFLSPGAPEARAHLVAAFRKGLSETGYVEGRNVAIEYRWAQNELDRLPELAADLVRRRVAVIATPGGGPNALAAKAATTTIPIVFRTGADPVQLGYVASLNRPGGNVTGVNALTAEVITKRIGLLHELLPRATRFAALLNPNDPNAELVSKDLGAGAAAVGRRLELFTATNIREIDVAFANLVQTRPDALVIVPQGLLINRRLQIVTLATRHALPAIYPSREFAEIGGLMSYGSSPTDQFRQAGVYTGRILKGEKPADMPVLRASKFEFVINLLTAKAFGLDVPATLLARADEVIE
jgi:putative tryptophan/tyrosine transport system substrate-binding protein